jgi:hypothetical protein
MPADPRPEPPSLETRLREMAACDCGQESLGRAEHASYCQTRGARAQAMVEAAETIVSLHQQLAEAEAARDTFDAQARDAEGVLCRISKKLKVPLDWHCEPFPAEPEVIAAIDKLAAAEARIATLEQQLTHYRIAQHSPVAQHTGDGVCNHDSCRHSGLAATDQESGR